MGCGNSTNTTVRSLVPDELKGDEDETGSKHSSRGDSAASKSTTDSGVVMENREVPALPGVVPRKLPPLTSAASPRLLRRDSPTQERLKSSEILEELLNQGIIPVGPARDSGSGAGEAYSIMLNNREGALRRPPARLESLKANKTLRSREEIDEKIRLAEERRKLKEDELKSRLRAKSARVRVPARSMSPEEDEDTSPFSDAGHKPEDPLNAPPQISYSANESSETVSAGDGRQSRDTQMKKEDRVEAKESGENNNVVAITQEGDLSDSADSDISFQHATAIDEVF